jgi:L-fucose isomerase-like protein
MLGHHANGMTDTSPNEFLLKKIIGPRVFWLDLPDILAQVANMPEAKVEKLWKEVRSRAGACKVTNADGLDSMRAYTVLKEIIDKEGLHAISIGCYPHLMGRICLAASLLADENIPIACEGDVHGAIGQIMLQLLTGQATHNTDWLDPVDAESVVFTHCGSGSFSLAEKQNDIRLAPVRLMNQGACALFTAKPGPVTLVNITAHLNGYQCAVLEGEAIPTEMVFPGNPVRVRFDEPVETLLDWIHDTGLGHHWMIGYGHVAAEIQAWSKIVSENMKFMSR